MKLKQRLDQRLKELSLTIRGHCEKAGWGEKEINSILNMSAEAYMYGADATLMELKMKTVYDKEKYLKS